MSDSRTEPLGRRPDPGLKRWHRCRRWTDKAMPCPFHRDSEPPKSPEPRTPFDWVKDFYLRDINISRRVGWSGPTHDAFTYPFRAADRALQELVPRKRLDGMDAGARVMALLEEGAKKMGPEPTEFEVKPLTPIRDESSLIFDVINIKEKVVEEVIAEALQPQYGMYLPSLHDTGGGTTRDPTKRGTNPGPTRSRPILGTARAASGKGGFGGRPFEAPRFDTEIDFWPKVRASLPGGRWSPDETVPQ